MGTIDRFEADALLAITSLDDCAFLWTLSSIQSLTPKGFCAHTYKSKAALAKTIETSRSGKLEEKKTSHGNLS